MCSMQLSNFAAVHESLYIYIIFHKKYNVDIVIIVQTTCASYTNWHIGWVTTIHLERAHDTNSSSYVQVHGKDNYMFRWYNSVPIYIAVGRSSFRLVTSYKNVAVNSLRLRLSLLVEFLQHFSNSFSCCNIFVGLLSLHSCAHQSHVHTLVETRTMGQPEVTRV